MRTLISIILSLFLLSGQCKRDDKNCHKTILFINKSSKAVYIESSGGFPDTLSFKNEFPNPALNPDLFRIDPNSENDRGLWRRDCYELAFNSVIIPSDTLMVFVFDGQILETTPWDSVKANYLVLRRYDLSLEDLRRLNWTIIYP